VTARYQLEDQERPSLDPLVPEALAVAILLEVVLHPRYQEAAVVTNQVHQQSLEAVRQEQWDEPDAQVKARCQLVVHQERWGELDDQVKARYQEAVHRAQWDAQGGLVKARYPEAGLAA